MQRFLLTLALVCFTSAATATPTLGTVHRDTSDLRGGISSAKLRDTPAAEPASARPRLSTNFCEAADCGSLPPLPGEPGGEYGATSTCVKKTTYKTCLENCTCEYNKARKKCNNTVYCLRTALTAKEICDTGCVTDFIP